MALDYVAIAQLAQDLVEPAGREVVARRLSHTPTDSNKPWRGTETPRASGEVEYEVTVKGVFVEPYSLIRYGFTLNDVNDVRRYDIVVIFASKSFTDQGVDFFGMNELVDGDTAYTVRYIRELRPGDVPLLAVIGANR